MAAGAEKTGLMELPRFSWGIVQGRKWKEEKRLGCGRGLGASSIKENGSTWETGQSKARATVTSNHGGNGAYASRKRRGQVRDRRLRAPLLATTSRELPATTTTTGSMCPGVHVSRCPGVQVQHQCHIRCQSETFDSKLASPSDMSSCLACI